MRFTKLALLIFGAGLVLGLVATVVEIGGLARIASLTMTLGIVGVPIGAGFDWCLASRSGRRRGKRQVRRAKPTSAGTARARKPRAAKR